MIMRVVDHGAASYPDVVSMRASHGAEKDAMHFDDKYRRIGRAISAGLGLLLLASAVLADVTGLSGTGAGRGQLILAASGLLLIILSIFRDPARAYRTAAVLLLNTLVLAVVLELAATGIYRLRAGATHRMSGSRADPDRPIAELMRANYAMYVVWRELPHTAPDFTIGEDRRRIVTGASEDPDAYEVFMFGGSTMIGWCVPDSLTIPSIMQRRLSSSMSVPVRVVNFGQQAFVSTQELIELELQLQDGRRPDLVVFYDGINDTFAALQTGIPGAHQNLDDIAGRFAGSESVISFWEALAGRSNLVGLARELIDKGGAVDSLPTLTGGGIETDFESLSAGIVSVYAENCRMATALGAEYGFECAFFWQPYLGSGEGAGAQPGVEERVEEVMDEALSSLLEATYSRASGLETSIPGFEDISGCLDGCTGEPFAFCDFCHIDAEGNTVVAETMIESLLSAGAIPDSLLRDSFSSAPER